MAKPRVFISSTYYDLHQTREDLAQFISLLGYEPVRNEEGNIPYGKVDKLEEYCYREIQNVDILINIIGGRFGSGSTHSDWSISNEELRTAIKMKKQVYIFIEKNVLSEYETYLCNKNNNIKYRYVDDVKIYQFVEELKSLSSNNNIKAFESSTEIQNYLKEQLAGLFQSFLSNQERMSDYDLSGRLEGATKTLEKLVDYLREVNAGNEEGITKLLKVNSPFVRKLSQVLSLKYDVGFDNLDSLTDFLSLLAWELQDSNNVETEKGVFVWRKKSSPFEKSTQLKINSCVFEEDGKLRSFTSSSWSDDWVSIEAIDDESSFSTFNDVVENLPF